MFSPNFGVLGAVDAVNGFANGALQGEQLAAQRSLAAAMRQHQIDYQNGMLQARQDMVNRLTQKDAQDEQYRNATALGNLAQKYQDKILNEGMAPSDAMSAYLNEAGALPGMDLGTARDFAVRQWSGSALPAPDASAPSLGASSAPPIAPSPTPPTPAPVALSGPPMPDMGASPTAGPAPTPKATQSPAPQGAPALPTSLAPNAAPAGSPPSTASSADASTPSFAIPGVKLDYNDPVIALNAGGIDNANKQISAIQQQLQDSLAGHPEGRYTQALRNDALQRIQALQQQIGVYNKSLTDYLQNKPTKDLADWQEAQKEYAAAAAQPASQQAAAVQRVQQAFPQFADRFPIPGAVLAPAVSPTTTSTPAFTPAEQASMIKNGGGINPVSPAAGPASNPPPLPSQLLGTPNPATGQLMPSLPPGLAPSQAVPGTSAFLANAVVDKTTPGTPAIVAPPLKMSLPDQANYAKTLLENRAQLVALREQAIKLKDLPTQLALDDKIKGLDAQLKGQQVQTGAAGLPYAGQNAANNATIIANRAATSAPGYVKPGSASSSVRIDGMTRAQVGQELAREQAVVASLSKRNDFLSTPNKSYIAGASQIKLHPGWKAGSPLSPRGFSGQFQQEYQNNQQTIADANNRIQRLQALDSKFDNLPSSQSASSTPSGTWASPTAKNLVGYIASAADEHKVVPDDQNHWCGQFLSNAYRSSSGVNDLQSVSNLAAHNRIQPGPDGSIPNGTGVFWPNPGNPNGQHFGIYANGHVYESTTQGAPAGKRMIRDDRTIAEITAAHGGQQPVFFAFPPASKAASDVKAGPAPSSASGAASMAHYNAMTPAQRRALVIQMQQAQR